GPMVEYYLPTAESGPITMEILDQAGTVVNSYNSETPTGGRGGRGGRGGGAGAGAAPAGAEAPAAQEAPDPEAGGGGRGRGGPPPRVTKTDGINRFTWDVRNQAGIPMPPGAYQARLKVGTTTETQPLILKIDP